MVQINFAQKSVTVKIVYYGPGMSGKTTNLEIVHQRAPESSRGELTSISTDGDRTLFFDFMPLDLGTVAGMKTQFQIYTVPGQVYYNSTRKLVLQGVDGVIFVADSASTMMQENLESLANLDINLTEYGKDINTLPMVIQYNKRDLPDAMPVAELEQALNPRGVPSFEGIANTGQGVFPTLKALAASVLESIHEQSGEPSAPAAASPAQAETAAPAAAAPPPVAAAPPAPIPQPQQAAAPQPGAAPAGPPPLQPQVQSGGTGFYPAPAAPGVPPASSAAGTPAPALQMNQPPQPSVPASPLPAAPAGGGGVPAGFPQPALPPQAPDPLSQTNVHAAPQFAANVAQPLQNQGAAPQAAPGMRMIPSQGAPPAVGQPAVPGVAAFHPPGQVAPGQPMYQQPMQPMQRPAANPPPVPGRAVAQAQAQAAARMKPRARALATPRGARKSFVITLIFVVLALGAGVAAGGMFFDLF